MQNDAAIAVSPKKITTPQFSHGTHFLHLSTSLHYEIIILRLIALSAAQIRDKDGKWGQCIGDLSIKF